MDPIIQIRNLSLKKHPVQDHRLQKGDAWIVACVCLTLGLLLMVRVPPGLLHFS